MSEYLKRETFEPHLNTTFRLLVEGGDSIDLELVEATDKTPERFEGEQFSLIFKGPLDPFIPQQTCLLDHPALGRGVQFISEKGPSPKNMYYNYYATQVMFQYTSGEGPVWKKWNDVMRNYMVQTQSRRGHEAGSWRPRGSHASSGGRLYMTALAVCTLEVYYRHLPIFRQIDLEAEDADE